MARPKRVLSFMTQWGNAHLMNHNSSTPPSPAQLEHKRQPSTEPSTPAKNGVDPKVYDPTSNSSAPPSPTIGGRPRGTSNASRPGSRGDSRRNSLALGYQAPMMEVNHDTPAELQPIFTYLNSHSNKLYQEGYFLKLHDLDSRGRPSSDRVWNECFAQLVGTVLSLWDAAQLDAAGEDGEVIPTFINLTDASIKMIESLPMNGVDGHSLQNVLSISTAANNRYLLHFNSLHSLTQWTAGIRLAMFEHATLQEAYTGSILAGKGKRLNNIKTIMDRSRFPTEDWVRVRFGAGTPWRRCWCVISPPDEKAFAKAQKNMKKKSAYDRSMPTVKGDIKFFDTRKVTKKTQPIATITDAFAAYAIYPQNQALIDQSTLIKLEGVITIHASTTTTTEGFIFVMPEVHPAITGFEMMLRWIIPSLDTFALYGRPTKLIADVLDTRSLMFAMPNNRRYGYLELIDVAGLIHTEGSSKWSEREWRRQMKILTSKRITAGPSETATSGSTIGRRRGGSRSSINLPSSLSRTSLNLPPSRAGGGIKFDDEGGIPRSTPASRHGSPAHDGAFAAPPRTDSAPVPSGPFSSPHKRAASDRIYRPGEPSRLSFETNHDEMPPPPPPHAAKPSSYGAAANGHQLGLDDPYGSEGSSSEYLPNGKAEPPRVEHFQPNYARPMQPVQAPPQMAHNHRQRPPVQPNAVPDLRRANSAIDSATLAQLAEANRTGRARSSSGSQDDASMLQQQPPPGASMMAPSGNPNYTSANHYYGDPMNNGMGGAGMRDRRALPGKLGPPSMPTIPGTPAVEQDQFVLATGDSRRPPLNPSGPSAGSVKRKPLSPNYGR